MEDKRTNVTIGRIQFSIGTMNKRLSARIGSKMTFIGGDNNEGYFKSIKDAMDYIKENTEAFENCKSMKKLIWI